MILETERLLLREMQESDFDALHAIFSDAETMQHYPAPFDEAQTRAWIERNMRRYRVYGFGLWAVVLKETGEVIGDCGITFQNINGFILPEIGYHIRKDLQKRGYASEAARRCRDFFFECLPFSELYSYMKYTNVGSYSTALKYGMRFVEEYLDPVNTFSRCYRMTRSEWEALKREEK